MNKVIGLTGSWAFQHRHFPSEKGLCRWCRKGTLVQKVLDVWSGLWGSCQMPRLARLDAPGVYYIYYGVRDWDLWIFRKIRKLALWRPACLSIKRSGEAWFLTLKNWKLLRKGLFFRITSSQWSCHIGCTPRDWREIQQKIVPCQGQTATLL